MNHTIKLSEYEQGALAMYAVRKGMMMDSALKSIVAAGLKAVAAQAKNQESENHYD